MYHIFTLTLDDPCTSTVLTIDAIPDLNLPIGGSIATAIETTFQVVVTDSVSSTLGNGDGSSFCGSRTFSSPQNSPSYYSIGSKTGLIRMTTANPSLKSTRQTISLTVLLDSDATIKVTETFLVKIISALAISVDVTIEPLSVN